ncbi:MULTISPECIES: hypothetical protein [Pseudomonas putida group]|nr:MULTISPECIES: hypothetical protein [Pseudomonas putida group]
MDDQNEIEHEQNNDDHQCENDHGATATVNRNGVWLCTDCDTDELDD